MPEWVEVEDVVIVVLADTDAADPCPGGEFPLPELCPCDAVDEGIGVTDVELEFEPAPATGVRAKSEGL